MQEKLARATEKRNLAKKEVMKVLTELGDEKRKNEDFESVFRSEEVRYRSKIKHLEKLLHLDIFATSNDDLTLADEHDLGDGGDGGGAVNDNSLDLGGEGLVERSEDYVEMQLHDMERIARVIHRRHTHIVDLINEFQVTEDDNMCVQTEDYSKADDSLLEEETVRRGMSLSTHDLITQEVKAVKEDLGKLSSLNHRVISYQRDIQGYIDGSFYRMTDEASFNLGLKMIFWASTKQCRKLWCNCCYVPSSRRPPRPEGVGLVTRAFRKVKARVNVGKNEPRDYAYSRV